MTTTRRGFLTGMLALGAAPAIVRAASLMPIWVPPQELSVVDWTLDEGYYRGNVSALRTPDELTYYTFEQGSDKPTVITWKLTPGGLWIQDIRHG